MRTYKLKIKVGVFDPQINDVDLEHIIKQSLDNESIVLQSITVIED